MNMTTVPSNQLKAMQHEIADLKEQLAQLRIEADFNFEQYQDAGRLLCDLQKITEQQAEAIEKLRDHIELSLEFCDEEGFCVRENLENALAIQPSSDILQARDEKVQRQAYERAASVCEKEAVDPHNVPSVPEGYQLVPIEPTKAMMWALYGHWVGQLTHLDYGYYKAMLSAARSE